MHLVTTNRGTRALSKAAPAAAVCALLALGILVLAPVVSAAGIDGPGTYYVFRTFDTGRPLTPEQEAACSKHFGPRATTAAVKLNFGLFVPRLDRETGHVVEQSAGFLGLGGACSAPGAEIIDFFAHVSPSAAGMTSAGGPCPFSTSTAEPIAVVLNCKLQSDEATDEVLGSTATSNSVFNPRNILPGAPTGAIWTNYAVPRPGQTIPSPPGGTRPEVPRPYEGLQFYVFRSFDHTTAPSSPLCSDSQPGHGFRAAALSSAEPSLADGSLDPEQKLQRSAELSLCFADAGVDNRRATATVRLERGGDTIHVTATGDCRYLATAAGSALRQETCYLQVDPAAQAGIRGGLVTSNGLVRADEPLGTANSHVWTVALFADPAASTSPPPDSRTISGTSGDDRIRGTAGDDAIDCGGGDDTVHAGGGDDVIDCGPGADRILAGAGDDIVRGGTGADVVRGGRGSDRLRGERGRDRLRGGPGQDRLAGGPGRDTVRR